MSGKITLSKVEKLIDCQLELTKYEFTPLWNAVPAEGRLLFRNLIEWLLNSF